MQYYSYQFYRSLIGPSLSERAFLKFVILLAPLLLIAACTGGQPAPDFQVDLYEGGIFNLGEQAENNAVVVNFWYPSCPPCREEMPHFQAAWEQFQGDGVKFIGLFVPQGFDTVGDAKFFIEELGLTFSFATDDGAKIAQDYEILYFPTTYFIDKQGKVFRKEISNLDAETLTELVGALVGG